MHVVQCNAFFTTTHTRCYHPGKMCIHFLHSLWATEMQVKDLHWAKAKPAIRTEQRFKLVSVVTVRISTIRCAVPVLSGSTPDMKGIIFPTAASGEYIWNEGRK